MNHHGKTNNQGKNHEVSKTSCVADGDPHENKEIRLIGYNLNVMHHSACLVINRIIVNKYVALINSTPVDRASDTTMVP